MECIQIKLTENPEPFKEKIREMLREYDKEFVPPLSTRKGTGQIKDLENQEKSHQGIQKYYQDVLTQDHILATKNEKLVGFLTFIHGFEHKKIENYNPANYVSTILVEKEYRKKGVASKLYDKLLHGLPEEKKLENITARTWSGNKPHQNLLEKLGFERIHTIKNDRGNGIHTIYYGKKSEL